jgi:hypothetical protein
VPNKLFVLNDHRTHGVRRGHGRELCTLTPLPRGGAFLVLAKGELLTRGVHFTVRLTVFGLGGTVLAQDDFVQQWWNSDVTEFNALTLSVATQVPFEGGGGATRSGDTADSTEPRVGLSVPSELIGGPGYGTVSNITIAAIAADDLVQTTIPPDPTGADTVADVLTEVLLRTSGPDRPA